MAYCLGQCQDPSAIVVLKSTLANASEHPMVRHEAGEALGAIGDPESLAFLQTFLDDPEPAVAQTVELALARIAWLSAQGKPKSLENESESESEKKSEKKSEKEQKVGKVGKEGGVEFTSVDPAPGYLATTAATSSSSSSSGESELDSCYRLLVDETQDLFTRYRALFTLRNVKRENVCDRSKAAALLCTALNDAKYELPSDLLRHEIAFVLGQIALESCEPALTKALSDTRNVHMVRHEAAEALGEIASLTAMQTLQAYCNDSCEVVAESCQVAIDAWKHNADDSAFQYANGLEVL